MGRKKQIFPFTSYSKIVEAIMNGIRSPSDLEKGKVLSHRKLHKYLKMFTESGLLIRVRLPKRGNYVEYHLNEESISEHPIWRVFTQGAYPWSSDTPVFCIPLFIKANREILKWISKKSVRKKLKVELEELSKSSRAVVKFYFKHLSYFDEYPLLRALSDRHEFLDIQKIVSSLDDRFASPSICPKCLKTVSLWKYLKEGFESIPQMRRKGNEVCCEKCGECMPYYDRTYLRPKKRKKNPDY